MLSVTDWGRAARAGMMGLLLALASAFAPPVAAQNPFAPVANIDGGVITAFQLQQRLDFLTLLRAPGVDRDLVLETLIDEHLQVRAARDAGIEVLDADVQAGIAEFAGRANLEAEAFLQLVQNDGIAPETVRDFVRNGLYWRFLVQRRFRALARVSEQELDRAVALTTGPDAVRVLMSEIVLPLEPPFTEQNRVLAEDLAQTIQGTAQFEEAARRYSAAPTAPQGGRLDWLALSVLPPQVAAEALITAPGDVIGPMNLGSYIAVYMLRDLDERAPQEAASLAIDYAEVPIPGGQSPEARALADALRARSDTCDDLYGTTQELPVGPLARSALPARDLSRDLRLELAKLDDNEVSTLLTRPDGAMRFIMLCGRTAALAEGEREAVRQRLFNQRLESYADGYLDELRAEARITLVN